jgi:hypothetical protein
MSDRAPRRRRFQIDLTTLLWFVLVVVLFVVIVRQQVVLRRLDKIEVDTGEFRRFQKELQDNEKVKPGSVRD